MTMQSILRNAVRPLLFGMVHVQALPGSPRNCLSIAEIADKAVTEARIYKKAKLDGIIVENMHDIPYLRAKDQSPETVACMARVCTDIKREVSGGNFKIGVQILAAANREALGVAKAADLDFIRAEGFVFGHIADEGYIDASAGELIRYRRQISAENIAILADIKKKHSAHAITSDVSLAETAKAAQFFMTDGVIITGSSTGDPPSATDLAEVKNSTNDLPIFIGSGVTATNFCQFMNANGFIIGSDFKKDGLWSNDIDVDRLSKFYENYSEAVKS